MARRNSKSEAIRRYMEKNPEAGGSEIAKALKVNPALVYNVKAIIKRKGMASGKSSANGAGGHGAAEHVIAAAKFVKTCGGIAQAQSALAAAAAVVHALEK